MWRSGDSGRKSGPRVTLRVCVADAAVRAGRIAAAPQAARTDVNGAPAYVDAEGVLFWQVGPDRVLSVVADDVPDPAGVARRVAESVRPDPARTPVPLSLGGSTDVSVEVEPQGDWFASAVGAVGGVRYGLGLHTRDPPADRPGRPVTALGRDAVYREFADGVLTVPPASGRFLSVGVDTSHANRGTATAEVLTSVAEHVRFDPDPRFDWLS
ncbi:hypothetical protein AB0I60_16855 [Actinosynnema sp. NPDC050436]|uniref:hypothetical protein n=1 Tax=Actinosynnema sp. NPDC050436 TaxID=3155659 RepID=UPI0033F513DA